MMSGRCFGWGRARPTGRGCSQWAEGERRTSRGAQRSNRLSIFLVPPPPFVLPARRSVAALSLLVSGWTAVTGGGETRLCTGDPRGRRSPPFVRSFRCSSRRLHSTRRRTHAHVRAQGGVGRGERGETGRTRTRVAGGGGEEKAAATQPASQSQRATRPPACCDWLQHARRLNHSFKGSVASPICFSHGRNQNTKAMIRRSNCTQLVHMLTDN